MPRFKIYEDFMSDSKKWTIFCDMDGVLTNFVKRFKEIDDNPEKLTPNEYGDIHGKNSIWTIITPEGRSWWSDMEWMPDGRQFWNFIEPFRPIILSAPSRDKESALGKMEWLKRELKLGQNHPTRSPKNWNPYTRIIFNSQKYMFARSKYDILIDDTPKKVEDWRKAGGTAILHQSATQSIKELTRIFQEFEK